MEYHEPDRKRPEGFYISCVSLIMGWISLIPCVFFLGPIPLILGIIGYSKLNKNKQMKGKKYAIGGMILGTISSFLFILIYLFFIQASIHSKTTRVHDELRKSATALEAYYADYNTYPKPDFDTKGRPVLPKILTTPIAYMEELPRDCYDKDWGICQYGGGDLKGADPHNHWFKDGWIIISNGPDRKPGSNGVAINPFNAWSVNHIDFNLESSSLTYDPTNGMKSAGDIWRRGP